jgi:hypothetical protein
VAPDGSEDFPTFLFRQCKVELVAHSDYRHDAYMGETTPAGPEGTSFGGSADVRR